MSNVLIGIIGVILFIGLALAGALFLGDRFSDTRNTSVGSATTQAVSQVANAVNLYNAENIVKVGAGSDPSSLVATQYLKALPTNPGGTTDLFFVNESGASLGDASLVIASLNRADARRVCGAIHRQTANAQSDVARDEFPIVGSADPLTAGPVGCFMMSGDKNLLRTNEFYAFARM